MMCRQWAKFSKILNIKCIFLTMNEHNKPKRKSQATIIIATEGATHGNLNHHHHFDQHSFQSNILQLASRTSGTRTSRDKRKEKIVKNA